MNTFTTTATRAARRQFIKYAKTTRSGSWLDYGVLCINYVNANFTYDEQLWTAFTKLITQTGQQYLQNTNA